MKKFNAFSIHSKNNLAQSEYFKNSIFNFKILAHKSIGHFIHALLKNKKKFKNTRYVCWIRWKTLHLSELFGINAKIFFCNRI